MSLITANESLFSPLAESGVFTSMNVSCEFSLAGSDLLHLHQRFGVIKRITPSALVNYNGMYAVSWTGSNMYFAPAMVVLYLTFCFFGRRLMKDRLPFDMRWMLAVWNLLLSVFSLLGALHTAPYLLAALSENGLQYTVCRPAEAWYGCGPPGFWTALFIWSKVPELVDTVFIVMRKKPLIFLHWYHHISVLLFCWHSHGTTSSAGLWFISMNYSVHGVMYMYYFLTAIGYRPWWAPLVTIMQISQMFVGIFICAMTIFYKSSGIKCWVRWSNVYAGVVMYTSYLLLFVNFAVRRFLCKKGGSRKAKKPKQE